MRGAPLDAFWLWEAKSPEKIPEAIQRRRIAASRPLLEANLMGRRRERPRNADREHHRNAAATRIAAALEVIRLSDERWHGLAIWLSRSGMDRDAELLDRLAARSEQQ